MNYFLTTFFATLEPLTSAAIIKWHQMIGMCITNRWRYFSASVKHPTIDVLHYYNMTEQIRDGQALSFLLPKQK